MFFGLVRPVLLVKVISSATCSAAFIASSRKKLISLSMFVEKSVCILLPGQVASPGTRPVPLWYFSNVASYKATRDFINNAQFFVNRVLFPEISSTIYLAAESSWLMIKRATRLRGWRTDFSVKTDWLSGNTSVIIGKSPNDFSLL